MTAHNNQSTSPWTPTRDAILREAWELGCTANEIARAIFQVTQAGLSRDAVIGRARRLGLAKRMLPQLAAARAARERGRVAA